MTEFLANREWLELREKLVWMATPVLPVKLVSRFVHVLTNITSTSPIATNESFIRLITFNTVSF